MAFLLLWGYTNLLSSLLGCLDTRPYFNSSWTPSICCLQMDALPEDWMIWCKQIGGIDLCSGMFKNICILCEHNCSSCTSGTEVYFILTLTFIQYSYSYHAMNKSVYCFQLEKIIYSRYFAVPKFLLLILNVTLFICICVVCFSLTVLFNIN